MSIKQPSLSILIKVQPENRHIFDKIVETKKSFTMGRITYRLHKVQNRPLEEYESAGINSLTFFYSLAIWGFDPTSKNSQEIMGTLLQRWMAKSTEFGDEAIGWLTFEKFENTHLDVNFWERQDIFNPELRPNRTEIEVNKLSIGSFSSWNHYEKFYEWDFLEFNPMQEYFMLSLERSQTKVKIALECLGSEILIFTDAGEIMMLFSLKKLPKVFNERNLRHRTIFERITLDSLDLGLEMEDFQTSFPMVNCFVMSPTNVMEVDQILRRLVSLRGYKFTVNYTSTMNSSPITGNAHECVSELPFPLQYLYLCGSGYDLGFKRAITPFLINSMLSMSSVNHTSNEPKEMEIALTKLVQEREKNKFVELQSLLKYFYLSSPTKPLSFTKIPGLIRARKIIISPVCPC